MKKINTKEKIEIYYKDINIAKKYTIQRFSSPIGRYIHKKQSEFVNWVVNKYKIKSLLELGCGPGRISKEIKNVKLAYGVDTSEAMLKIARKVSNPNWKFKKMDAFNLSFKRNTFDLVVTFRFLRHFKKKERIKLYNGIRKVLKKNGLLIFDAVNYNKEYYVRKRVGFEKYLIYDKLYKKEELLRELENNGFKVRKLVGVCNHLYTITLVSKLFSFLHLNFLGVLLIRLIEKFPSKNPEEWIVLCQKK